MKECSKCGETDKTYRMRTTGIPMTECTDCELDYATRKAAYKRSVIKRYKQMKGCAYCGIKDYRVLQFDHIVPEDKSFTIASKISNKGLKTLFKEIKKCRVLCANCHSIKTYEEGDRQRRKDEC